MSLVELMVAMAISMIAMLAITQVYIGFEENKRTTVTGGDAQQNGILALQFIQQDLLMAGYGVVSAGALGCNTKYTADGGTTISTLKLVPAFIRADHPAANTDSLTVLYSTATGASGPPAVIRANHPQNGTSFTLDNTIGFRLNDFIAAFESNKDCTLLRVTNAGVTANGNTTLVHDHPASNYNVPTANTTLLPAAGYGNGASIFNLGQQDQVFNRRYQIVSGKLVMEDLFNGGTTELAEGIVALYAEYGIDTATPNPAVAATSATPNGDSIADTFVRPVAGADGYPNHAAFGTASAVARAAGWGRVYSIRVAVVSRSSLREKTEVSGDTIAYWPGGPPYSVPDRYYRYKIYHTIVPLRNMVWRRPGI